MVARRLVDSNLVGHDSHGVIRVGKYLEWMRNGWVRPNQSPTIVFESDTIAIIDGNRGFGQVVGEFAPERPHRQGRQDRDRHGRIAQLRSSRPCRGLGQSWRQPTAGVAALPQYVGRATRGTVRRQRSAPLDQPITVGIPVAGGDPVILDVTTSMVAEGKLFVAINKGEKVPEGWIIDKHGKPTPIRRTSTTVVRSSPWARTRARAFQSSSTCSRVRFRPDAARIPEDTVLRNNMLSIYIAPSAYDSEGTVVREVARFVDWVKASPPQCPVSRCCFRGNRASDACAAHCKRNHDRRSDLEGPHRRCGVGGQ